jgi:hypothetical protein
MHNLRCFSVLAENFFSVVRGVETVGIGRSGQIRTPLKIEPADVGFGISLIKLMIRLMESRLSVWTGACDTMSQTTYDVVAAVR